MWIETVALDQGVVGLQNCYVCLIHVHFLQYLNCKIEQIMLYRTGSP